jgi:hypothetical protein
MSSENPLGLEKDNRLDPEAAHETANMMRATLKTDPETGAMIDDGKNPAEWIAAEETFGPRPNIKDYDDALGAVEKLEALAAKESSAKKIIMFAERITEQAGYGTAKFLRHFLATVASKDPKDRDNGEEHKRIVEGLADAAQKLAELKKAARRYEDAGSDSDQEKLAA